MRIGRAGILFIDWKNEAVGNPKRPHASKGLANGLASAVISGKAEMGVKVDNHNSRPETIDHRP